MQTGNQGLPKSEISPCSHRAAKLLHQDGLNEAIVSDQMRGSSCRLEAAQRLPVSPDGVHLGVRLELYTGTPRQRC